MLDLGALLTASLLCSGFALAGALLLVIVETHSCIPSRLEIGASVGIFLGAAALAAVIGPFGWMDLIPSILGIIVLGASTRLLNGFTVSGRFMLVTQALLILFGLPWGIWFISTIPVDGLTRALLLAGYPLLVITAPAVLITAFEQWEAICRREWQRPQSPWPPRKMHAERFVSLHVPICS